MIILGLFFLVIGFAVGGAIFFNYGERSGATKIEREVLRAVFDSPEYEHAVFESIKKTFNGISGK